MRSGAAFTALLTQVVRPTIGSSMALIALWSAFELPCAGAREFSADIVSRDAAGFVQGTAAKLHVAGRKVRIETPDVAGFILIDTDAGAPLLVQPARRIFMDAKQSSLLTQIFVPVDPNDPCPQWQAAARAGAPSAGTPSAGSHWRCERICVAGAGGTVEYRVGPPERPTQRWVAGDLEFSVKIQASDRTTMTLEHIRLQSQPASMFAVPPGYRKLDPQALIDRLKRSDVWVEAPP
jgi:hypothetical protein